MKRYALPFSAAILGALMMWGCGGGGGGGSAVTTPTSATPPGTSAIGTLIISIISSTGSSAFQPNPVRANAGDMVMFRNTDSTLHHLVMDDGSADLGDIALGATSRGLRLASAGAMNFHCTLHPSMVGSINGAVPDAPAECVDFYGDPC